MNTYIDKIYPSFLKEYAVWFSIANVSVAITWSVFRQFRGVYGRFYSVSLGILIIISMMIHRSYVCLQVWYVTNKQLIYKSEFFDERNYLIPYENIVSIEILRPFLCQFFGNGVVTLHTISGRPYYIRNLSTPHTVRVVIETFKSRCVTNSNSQKSSGSSETV
jgi:hypothetical protein